MPEFEGSLLDKTMRHFKSALVQAGWYEIPWIIQDHEGSYQSNYIESLLVGNRYYPTLVSRTHQVKIAISADQFIFHNNRVYCQTLPYSKFDYNTVHFAGLLSSPESRRKGNATRAMKEVVQAANKAKAILRLEPVVLTQYKRIGYRQITYAKLVKWYQSLGFEPLRDFRNLIMEYVPEVPASV